MDLPNELKVAIDNITVGVGYTQLMKDFQNLSERYRNNSSIGESILKNEREVISYAVARMPATYGAVLTALQYAMELSKLEITSLIDCGAGTGAAAWAANSLFDLETIICLERDEMTMKIGKKLMKRSHMEKVKWMRHDIACDVIPQEADMIIASYVLNEMNRKDKIKTIDKLWSKAKKVLLIVEPGTKTGYEQVLENREILIGLGANILAPCPHENICKLEEGSWCHFSCRIPRSKVHRLIKEGDAPFEDEKFSYIAATRDKFKSADFRILRHPYVAKGHVSFDLCSLNGINKVIVSRKDKELFKQARKAKWGDVLKNIYHKI